MMPPEWWPEISCPRRHGWWVQAVDSAILTRCKRCSGMVQLTFMDSASKTCHSCRSSAEPRNPGLAFKPKSSNRSCPHGSKRCRTRKVSPGSEMRPYSALRPLDEALPGELDLEGWDSDDDRDNRGPERHLSPSPVPERKKKKGLEAFSNGSSSPCPPMTNLGSPLNVRPTEVFADGGEMAGRGGNARVRQVSESPHPDPPPPNRDKIAAGGTLTRSSSSSSSRSSRSDFGFFTPYGHLTMPTPGSSPDRVGTRMLTGAMEVLNLAARSWTEGIRRNKADEKTQPLI